MNKRIIGLLDWCWPFPLGILAGTLVLAMVAGIWLALGLPRAPRAEWPAGRASSIEFPAPVPNNDLPSAAQDTAPVVHNQPEARMPYSSPAPAPKSTSAAGITKSPVERPKSQPRRAAAPLSAKQQAEISDRLTIGRFLADRKEYSAAIKEFQAALTIDPSSREARKAIQEAREASRSLNSTPKP